MKYLSNKLYKYIVIFTALISFTSCTPTVPYEVHSPCVTGLSLDENHPYAITPCIRKPINLNRDLA